MIRSALKNFLIDNPRIDGTRISPAEITQLDFDLENGKGEFSFNKMITVFSGCVSVRSLEGLVQNSFLSQTHIDRQTKMLNTALERLTWRTIAQEEPGWKMIGPLFELAKKYQVDPDTIKLEAAYPPLKNVQPYFLKDGNVLGTLIFHAQSYEKVKDSGAHAVVIIRIETTKIPIAGGGQLTTREFVIKNSYNADKIVRIPEIYNIDEFDKDRVAFKAKFAGFAPDDYLILPFGAHLKFSTI